MSLGEPLVLRWTATLQQPSRLRPRANLPLFARGVDMQGRADHELQLQYGELRQADVAVRANVLRYDQPGDHLNAHGDVVLRRGGDRFEGPTLSLELERMRGTLERPSFHLLSNDAYGEASRIDFIDADRSIIQNSSLSTCKRQPGPTWLPDWVLTSQSLEIDQAQDTGTARGALVTFKGVPLLPIPYISFPLSERRRSGLLPPTPGLDSVNGFEWTQPIYWNIAPSHDATITPTLMSKRGINVASEWRYLEPAWSGELHLDGMPADALRPGRRWGLSWQHRGGWRLPLLGSATDVYVNFNRVSDDDYWRDFSRAYEPMAQRLLPQDLSLRWSGASWSMLARALRWQTLQDPGAPIVPPYDRLPQLAWRWTPAMPLGLQAQVELDTTHFIADTERTGQPNAQRDLAMLRLARRWDSSAAYVEPRLQWQGSRYRIDAPIANSSHDASLQVPTFSLDAGLALERPVRWWGRALRQTLEPRLLYVNTPYREQSQLPNYDSAAYDFSFATVFTENAFIGHDRVSDSNLLTLGLTSRLVDVEDGSQVARFGLAQRLRFKDQRVVLPGTEPVAERLSDLLLSGGIDWDPSWSVDGTWQFNPKTSQSTRVIWSARYHPGAYRTLMAAYRYQRDASEQLELGWQWPLNGPQGLASWLGQSGEGSTGRWYGVGRLNYSMREGKLVDSILGLEYDAGCWLGRVVLERQQTGLAQLAQRVIVQLDLVGFARLGVSPLRSLKDNIPTYQNLRERGDPPSIFTTYD